MVPKITCVMAKKWGQQYKILSQPCYPKIQENWIRGVRDELDVWQDQPDIIASTILGYYENLFSTSTTTSYTAHLDHIPHLISEEMNQVLMGDFLEAEVSLALK